MNPETHKDYHFQATTTETHSSESLSDRRTANYKMSLTEVAYQRRLQKYHRQKRIQAEQRMQICRTSWVVRDRLIQSRRQLLSELAKALRSEDQTGFIPIFQAFHNTEAACNDYDMTECSLPPDHGPKDSVANTHIEPFLDHLPESSSDILTQFINKITSDPEFLVRHLLSLSVKNFDTLMKYYSPSRQSVLRNDKNSQHAACKERPDLDSLDVFLDFGRRDCFFLLLQIVSPPFSGNSVGYCVQYWGRVCAALIADRKPGANNFFVAVLNTWPVPEKLGNLQVLENWLLEVLRDGEFLLESSDKYSFRMRAQPRDGIVHGDPDATDAFFTKSMNRLLELLRNTSVTNVIPKVTLQLCHAIATNLSDSPRQHQMTAYFVCTHWLFSSYLGNIIKNPESCGLLLSCHISSNARRRILDELANRLHRLAFDVAYTWKHSVPVDPVLLNNMQAVISLFHPEQTDQGVTSPSSRFPAAPIDTMKGTDAIVLCPLDLQTLVHGLFPEPLLDLDMSVLSLRGSTVHSSASSISGFSLLKTPVPYDDLKVRPNGSTLKTDVGEPSMFDASAGAQRADDTFSRSPGRNDDNFQDRISEDLLITQLKAICIELAAMNGTSLNSTHRDLFCESWASVPIARDYAFPSIGKRPLVPTGFTSTGSPNAIEEDIDDPSFPNAVKKAVYSILTHLENTRTVLRRSAHDDTNGLFSGSNDENADGSSSLDDLLNAIESTIRDCQRKGRFAKAQTYYQASIRIKSMLQSATKGAELIEFVNRLARDAQRAISIDRLTTKSCACQADQYKMERDIQRLQIREITETLSRLREKMWYVSSVRFASHYEDLFRVTGALRVMGLPRRPTTDKALPSLRRKPTMSGFHDSSQLKTESAILDLLAAPPAQGGPNKLSDRQIKLTSDWLQSQGVENICRGEERLHRFCQEVSRCVDYLVGDSTIEHPVLWSSELFSDIHSPTQHGHGSFDISPTTPSARERLQAMYSPRQRQRPLSSMSHGRAGVGHAIPYSSQATSPSTAFSSFGRTSFGHPGSSCSPTLTNTTSDSLWSSFTAGAPTASSITSLPSRTLSRPLSDRSSYGSLGGHQCQPAFLEELKHNVTGLLLSDLGQLFRQGSETDLSFWSSFGGRFANRLAVPAFDGDARLDISGSPPASRPFRYDSPHDPAGQEHGAQGSRFAFDPKETFQKLFFTFEMSSSPFEKLRVLHQVQETYEALFPTDQPAPKARKDSKTEAYPHTSTKHSNPTPDTNKNSPRARTATNQTSIHCFHYLFKDPTLRPKTLFLSLQYIASLVPSSMLDSPTPLATSYWSAVLAALTLKEDITTTMIETADAIVSHHTIRRGHSFAASPAQASRDSATFTTSRPNSATAMENVGRYTMADAAELYLIAAREGDPVAQRELATLYLTHPDVLPRVTAPMARGCEVFKGAAVEAALRGRKNSGSGGLERERDRAGDRERGGERDRGAVGEKYDPLTMAVARHWMELAAQGGDELAVNTLKAKDEIERIP